jgi:hypothetical protein
MVVGAEDRGQRTQDRGSSELRMERLGLFLDDHPGAATQLLSQSKDKEKK